MAHSLKTWKIPTSGRAAKGVPLPQVLPISSEEDDNVAGVLSVQANMFEDQVWQGLEYVQGTGGLEG